MQRGRSVSNQRERSRSVCGGTVFPQPNRFLNISIVVCTQNLLNTCTCSTKAPPLWSQLCVANLSQVPTGMMFWSHFREGFCQTATYDQEWLIPITVRHICLAMFTIIFQLFIMNYYDFTSKIFGFPTSRWEDKVTATKIKGSSTLMKTLLRGCSRVD